jgi:Fe-S-cluster-containing dehydrogenase component
LERAKKEARVVQTEVRAQQRHADVSRRRFLKALGAAGGSAAVAASILGEHGAFAAAEDAQHQWAFVIDLRKCDGCEACTKACQSTHSLAKDQKWINVYKMTDASGQTHPMPRLCMHCENPEGVVLVNQEACIGCRTCMAACPYEARYFNWQEPPPAKNLLDHTMPEFPVPQKKGTVGKCILCVHNTVMGKLPACVEACNMGALYIGDLKTDVATNGHETVKLSRFLRENDAVRYREELGTRPRVWYILGHGQKLDF